MSINIKKGNTGETDSSSFDILRMIGEILVPYHNAFPCCIIYYERVYLWDNKLTGNK